MDPKLWQSTTHPAHGLRAYRDVPISAVPALRLARFVFEQNRQAIIRMCGCVRECLPEYRPSYRGNEKTRLAGRILLVLHVLNVLRDHCASVLRS